MLIRISTTRAAIPRSGEGIAFVHGEIQPQISAMDGNRGFGMAVDHSSGRYVGIAAWTDGDALRAGSDRAPGLISDVARHLDGGEPTVEVFDLALAHVAKPVRVGYWGQLVRMEVPAHELERTVRRFAVTALPVFERYDGLAAIVLFVDRSRNLAESVIWYDGLAVLRSSGSRLRELQDLLVADVPALHVLDVAELEVVIAEGGFLSWS